MTGRLPVAAFPPQGLGQAEVSALALREAFRCRSKMADPFGGAPHLKQELAHLRGRHPVQCGTGLHFQDRVVSLFFLLGPFVLNYLDLYCLLVLPAARL
ncbi:MAG: hypothetical protein V3T81_07025, partial [Thermoanaerobaculia bacterium]